MLELYNEKWFKARKKHTCECCGKLISVGEKYNRQNGKYDGDFFDRKFCITCYGAVRDYCCEVDNEFDYDLVQEYMQEKFCHKCSTGNEDIDNECVICVLECPKLIEHYRKELGELE